MLRLVTLLILSLFVVSPSLLSAKTYYLYFMAGQSNMEGFGYVKDLPDELRKSTSQVMMFHGNMQYDTKSDGGLGMWSNLQPGHGTGFKSNGISNEYSLRFGPELSFGHSMASRLNKRIAIIKYSAGGTGLSEGVGYGNWHPDFDGINQYDNALTTIKAAMYDRDVDNDGVLDTLIPSGIIWMQGEADAHQSQAAADAYLANLTRIMDLFRAALHTDDLPLIIGKINRSGMKGYEDQMPFIEIVNKAHIDFTNADPCATYVPETKDYSFSEDGWHYDSESFIKMGQAFAREMHQLQQSCKVK